MYQSVTSSRAVTCVLIIEMAGLAEGSSRESVLSLQEVIEEDTELEQMANAVLGASDDKKCTYPQVTTIQYGISAHVYLEVHSLFRRGT